jgi:uncharacterized protein YegL
MNEQILTLRAVGHERPVAVLHPDDAASLAWFVSQADVWVRSMAAGERQRIPAVCDTQKELGGSGTILLPRSTMEGGGIAEAAPVLVSSAKPHLPSVVAITRVTLPGKPAEAEASVSLDIAAGVPPDVLPDVPRRNDPSPERLIVLFDNSGSMSGAPLEEAKTALQSLFVEKLMRPAAAFASQADEVGLIRFGETCEVVFTATPRFMDEIPRVLALTADGGTPMDEALRLVPAQFDQPAPWVSANRRAILLTDGGAQVTAACLDQLVKAGVTVICIAIGDPSTATLDAIASATGGAVVNATSLWQLDGILAALA